MTAGNHDHTHSDHHAGDAESVGIAVLTVSSSRTLETDPAGDAIVAAIEDSNNSVAARDLIEDDADAIAETVRVMKAGAAVAAVVTTGGTGLTPADVTVEALGPLFDREIPGFGEEFRRRSVADVGEVGILSRATAGVIDGVVVFCLPGSEAAARLGIEDLVLPVLGHAVGLASGGDDHSVGEHENGTHEHSHDSGGDAP